jgi:glycosyltransferase involved in cell wall biosynthesis
VEVRREGEVKILLVNYEFPPVGGGAANATYFTGRALAGLGHDIWVLTAAFRDQVGLCNEEGMNIVRVASRRAAVDRSNLMEMLSFALAAPGSAVRIAREQRIDGVIAYFTVPCGHVGYLLRRRLGIPYIVSLRGGDVPRHVPELDNFHRLLTLPRRAFLRNATAVVANSESLARLSEKTDPVAVTVIPNGVDSNFFSPHPNGNRAREKAARFLFVGRLVPSKNLLAVFEAMAALKKSNNLECNLDIVGDGPQLGELQRLSQDHGVGQRVTWHGWLEKEGVRELYRQCDCFLNPSLYEGMPNTVLEAMASGLPVIASDVGGNNALVRDGQTGFLVDLAAPAALSSAMAKCARDPELHRRLGARGREIVEREFSWQSVATRYVELFSARRT